VKCSTFSSKGSGPLPARPGGVVEAVAGLAQMVGWQEHLGHLTAGGTMANLEAHAELMKKHPGMEHDEPNMAHVAAKHEEALVWQFDKPGEFYYACLLPGHFEAGMVGKVIVASR